MDAWLYSSLSTKHSGFMMAGKFRVLVANPIPNTIASSTPKNSAVSCSSSKWRELVPSSWRELPIAQPYFLIISIVSFAHGPEFWAKPK